jgi:hypothetical protein
MSPPSQTLGSRVFMSVTYSRDGGSRNLFASWSPIVRYSKDAGRTVTTTATTTTLLRGDQPHFPGCEAQTVQLQEIPQCPMSEKYHEGVQVAAERVGGLVRKVGR